MVGKAGHRSPFGISFSNHFRTPFQNFHELGRLPKNPLGWKRPLDSIQDRGLSAYGGQSIDWLNPSSKPHSPGQKPESGFKSRSSKINEKKIVQRDNSDSLSTRFQSFKRVLEDRVSDVFERQSGLNYGRRVPRTERFQRYHRASDSFNAQKKFSESFSASEVKKAVDRWSLAAKRRGKPIAAIEASKFSKAVVRVPNTRSTFTPTWRRMGKKYANPSYLKEQYKKGRSTTANPIPSFLLRRGLGDKSRFQSRLSSSDSPIVSGFGFTFKTNERFTGAMFPKTKSSGKYLKSGKRVNAFREHLLKDQERRDQARIRKEQGVRDRARQNAIRSGSRQSAKQWQVPGGFDKSQFNPQGYKESVAFRFQQKSPKMLESSTTRASSTELVRKSESDRLLSSLKEPYKSELSKYDEYERWLSDNYRAFSINQGYSDDTTWEQILISETWNKFDQTLWEHAQNGDVLAHILDFLDAWNELHPGNKTTFYDLFNGGDYASQDGRNFFEYITNLLEEAVEQRTIGAITDEEFEEYLSEVFNAINVREEQHTKAHNPLVATPIKEIREKFSGIADKVRADSQRFGFMSLPKGWSISDPWA